MSSLYQPVETPFNFRHTCWFCGEPSYQWPNFPRRQVTNLSHPKLQIPACDECAPIVAKSKAAHIYLCREQVKKALRKAYQKHLAIGVQWTKDELENSGFEGKALEGFAESGWAMFEIARDRINYAGWPLAVAGVEILESECCDVLSEPFSFDGVDYPSLNEAITQYALAFHFERRVLSEAVSIVGRQRFSQAVSFCRLLIGLNYASCRSALSKLRYEFGER